jgi:GNAT superfamily N-acetyltransferase
MEIDATQYWLRSAGSHDAEAIARQRAWMFRDMGSIAEEEAEPLFRASVPWFHRMLAAEEYVGWLVLWRDEIVAGGGIHVREMGPIPGCLRIGRWGHIANLYTAPVHRRRGVARLLMEAMLAWGERNQLDRVTLTASEEGRSLYASLGFAATADMQLMAGLAPPAPFAPQVTG